MVSSERPWYSSRSTWVNGSRRPPNRDLVRRTPLATARTRPVLRASTVTMWSASPSFCVRSTTPSSRYSCMGSLSRTAPTVRDMRAVGWAEKVANERTRMSGYGFGVVGAGVSGASHAAAIAIVPGVHLVAVTDLDPGRAGAFAGRHGCVAAPDLDALLARDDVDVVAVCVPSGLHAEVGVRAAGAGKHLVIEKPIDVSLAAADRLLPAAGAATLAMDGGALMNQGIHYADLLRWCLGPVAEVSALTVTQAHAMEAEDCALATVRFTSGAVGTITATTSVVPGFPERLEISGTEGSAVVEDGVLVYRELRGETNGTAGAEGS